MTTRAVNQAARKRMADTGEPYTVARRAIQDHSPHDTPAPHHEAGAAENPLRLGSYPNGLGNPVHWCPLTTERAEHMVIYGRSGSGKSVLACTIAAQAVQSVDTFIVTHFPKDYPIPAAHLFTPRVITPEGEVGPAPVELDSLADGVPKVLILDYWLPTLDAAGSRGFEIEPSPGHAMMDAEQKWFDDLFRLARSNRITLVMISQTPLRPQSSLGRAMSELDVVEVVMGTHDQFAPEDMVLLQEQGLYPAQGGGPRVPGLGTVRSRGRASLPFVVDEPFFAESWWRPNEDGTMPAGSAV